MRPLTSPTLQIRYRYLAPLSEIVNIHSTFDHGEFILGIGNTADRDNRSPMVLLVNCLDTLKSARFRQLPRLRSSSDS